MESAVWTACSDSEDAEIDEEGTPSTKVQQGSFYEVALQSSTLRMSKNEQELVTEEDLGETAEKWELYNSTYEFGDSRKQKFRRPEIERKKRNFGEDEPSQAYKLAKISQHLQKKQIPRENTEGGENASDPTCFQWSDSLQASPLEENYAAEEPINCTQSAESFSDSSLLVERQDVPTKQMTFTCPECNITCMNSWNLNRHRAMFHKTYACPERNKRFVSEGSIRKHRHALHNAEKQCSKCKRQFRSLHFLKEHWMMQHAAENFKCDKCGWVFKSPSSLGDHQIEVHFNMKKKAFQCTACLTRFSKSKRLKNHECSALRIMALKSNKRIANPDTLPERISNPDTLPERISNPDTLPERISNPDTLPERISNPDALPKLMSNPGTLPKLISNPGTLANLVSNPGTLPNLISIPGILPNLVSKPGTLPNLVSSLGTLPNLVSNPGTLHNLFSNQGTFPNLVSNPSTLPNLVSNLGTLPNLVSNLGTLPNLVSNPGTLPNNQVTVHNAENLFQCLYCNVKFSSSWHLNNHLLSHINVLRMQLNIQQVITYCPSSSQGPWFRLPL